MKWIEVLAPSSSFINLSVETNFVQNKFKTSSIEAWLEKHKSLNLAHPKDDCSRQSNPTSVTFDLTKSLTASQISKPIFPE